MRNKSILITGGFGFIGKSFIKKYSNRFKKIFLLDNLQFSFIDKEIVRMKNVIFIKGDLRDENIFKKIPKVNYICHLGSPSSIILFKKEPDDCINSTIKGFINVLNFAKNNKIEKLIYPSSGSVYGKNDFPFNEKIENPHPVNIYGKTKLACEYIAKIYENLFPIVGLRIFAGFGIEENHKKDFASVIDIFVNKALKGEIIKVFGDGNQKRDFIYIDDIIEAIFSLLKNQYTGIINIGSGVSLSFNQIIKLIKKEIKNVEVKYIDKPMDYLEETRADISLFKKLFNKRPSDPKKKIIEFIKIKKRNLYNFYSHR